jgi:hypothetical protein
MRGPAGQASLRNRTVLGVFFGEDFGLWEREASGVSGISLCLRKGWVEERSDGGPEMEEAMWEGKSGS